MATDPGISLQVAAAQPPPAGGAAPGSGGLGGVLGTVGALVGLRSTMAQFQARQQLGQVIAGSPDLASGLDAASKDPSIVGFAGQALGELRGLQQTLVGTQGLQAGQNTTALQAVMKAAMPALNDPSKLGNYVRTAVATLPPEIAQRNAGAISSWVTSLTDGLPGDPAAARTEFNKRYVAQLFGAGVGPDAVNGILGTRENIQQGNVIQPAIVPPIQFGGGPQPVGPGFGVGTPAGYQTVAGVPTAAPGVPGNFQGSLGGEGGTPPSGAPPAGDGNALLPPGGPGLSPAISRGTGVGGANLLSPTQQDQAKSLSGKFNDDELKTFNSAQQIQGSLRFMDSAFDNLAKGGGFLVPGTAGQARADIGKFVNTVAQVLGKDPAVDPTKIASAIDLQKETRRMALMVTNQFLGGQREAASVINGITQSVPGLDNSFMGAKLVSDSLKASVQRIIDQRNFKNAWQADPQNQGSLVGADEAFNTAHPAEGYANAVLDKYGLNEGGFKDPHSVGLAVQQGYLTPKQGADLLRQQFPKQFGGAAPAAPGGP